jgi:hypothetical protein
MLSSFAAETGPLQIIQPDLARVHALLWHLGDADGAFLHDLVRTLLDGPRDAHRAAAALLLARAIGDEVPAAVVQLAAAVQIVHAASLAHRFGNPDLERSLDERLVVLAGDYLYAQAAVLTAGLGNLAVMAELAESIKALCRAVMPSERGSLAGPRSVSGAEEAGEPAAAMVRANPPVAPGDQVHGLFRLSLWGTAEIMQPAPDLQAVVTEFGQALDACVAGGNPQGGRTRAAAALLRAQPALARMARAAPYVSGLLTIAEQQCGTSLHRQPV